MWVDEIPSNPKQLYGDAKVPLQLIPPSVEIALAKGLGEGAAKYGAWNWRSSKVEAMTYIGAIKRHLAAFVEGEDVDPDSTTGKTHLEGALASIAILIDAATGDFMIDNRPISNRSVLEALKEGSRVNMEREDGRRS